MIVDLVGIVPSIITAWKGANRAKAWGRLIFSMVFSGITSFYGVAGATRLAGQPEIMADGAGMLAVAVSLFTLFKASRLTRKMMIALPSDMVNRAEEANMTTVERN